MTKRDNGGQRLLSHKKSHSFHQVRLNLDTDWCRAAQKTATWAWLGRIHTIRFVVGFGKKELQSWIFIKISEEDFLLYLELLL